MKTLEAIENKTAGYPLTLQDVLTSGVSRPGFYVVSGTRALVPMVQERLVGFLYREIASPSSGSHMGIGKLMWVDSGNIFDPFHMARVSVQRGVNPTRILRSLQVARPFTAFQFQQMLANIPNPVLLNSQNAQGQKAPVWRVPFVIISDLMSLFYDPDLQPQDLERAFQQFQTRLSYLKKRAIVLGLHIRYKAPPGREHLFPAVLNMADRILSTQPFFHEALNAGGSYLAPEEQVRVA